MSNDDASQRTEEIAVTPVMLEAAAGAFDEWEDDMRLDYPALFAMIYRAMEAARAK